MTAAATPMSRARTGSNGWTAWAASTKIRCASAAEPMLTSMCPRSRAMSHSRSGSVGASRAAASRVWAWAACPHAHALRAAANVRRGALRRVGRQGRRALVGREGGGVPAATLRS